MNIIYEFIYQIFQWDEDDYGFLFWVKVFLQALYVVVLITSGILTLFFVPYLSIKIILSTISFLLSFLNTIRMIQFIND